MDAQPITVGVAKLRIEGLQDVLSSEAATRQKTIEALIKKHSTLHQYQTKEKKWNQQNKINPHAKAHVAAHPATTVPVEAPATKALPAEQSRQKQINEIGDISTVQNQPGNGDR